MKPVIGIVYCGFLTQGFERQSIYVTSSYLSAVEVSGGLPVVIPYFSDLNCIANYIKLFDGILFCGGDDVTPLLYHEELGTNRGHTDYKTDIFHFTFMNFHPCTVQILPLTSALFLASCLLLRQPLLPRRVDP